MKKNTVLISVLALSYLLNACCLGAHLDSEDESGLSALVQHMTMQENAASQVPQTPPPHVPALPPCDAHTHCHLQNDQDQDCGAAYIEDDARFIYQAKDPKHNWQRDVLQPEDWAHFEKLGVAYKKYTQTKIGGRPLWTKNPLTFSLEIGYRAFELDEVVQGIRILFGEPFDEEVPVEDTEGLMWHSFAISSGCSCFIQFP